MIGVIEALYRYPIKGFTPEPLRGVKLSQGEGVPYDRAYAVEDGDSGFDPSAPSHISKIKFTVLAKIPEVARIRTRFDEVQGALHAAAPGAENFSGSLDDEADRARFAAWLGSALGDLARGPLRVLVGPGAHRFYDHPQGFVSLINLESVRDLERRLARPINPLRFRANVYVSGWPAWSELERVGCTLRLGAVEATAFSPIVRCAATHVDPVKGERDIDLVEALRTHYGHAFCGLYLHVTGPGAVNAGDAAQIA